MLSCLAKCHLRSLLLALQQGFLVVCACYVRKIASIPLDTSVALSTRQTAAAQRLCTTTEPVSQLAKLLKQPVQNYLIMWHVAEVLYCRGSASAAMGGECELGPSHILSGQMLVVNSILHSQLHIHECSVICASRLARHT